MRPSPPQSRYRIFPLLQKVSSCPFAKHPSPQHMPRWQLEIGFPSSRISCKCNHIIYSLCLAAFAQCMCKTNACCCMSVDFYILLLSSIPLYGCTTISPVDRYWRCFQSFTIMNRMAGTIHVKVSVDMFLFFLVNA